MEDVWGSLLSEENKQRVKKKLKRNNETGEWPRENSSDSAVMVPLISVEGEPSVLFTLRSAQLSRHRNQVSFPGGHVDAGDGTPEGTALRELREELGLEASDMEVLGRLVNLPDKYGTSYITPVIGHVKNYLPGTLRVSCAEVQQVFTLPIRHLMNPANIAYTVHKSLPQRFPIFLGGPRKVWGLTAMILDITLMHLIPNRMYQPIFSSSSSTRPPGISHS